jgi:hypothetical protein
LERGSKNYYTIIQGDFVMGIMDAFNREDRVEVTFSTFYSMMRESAKAELMANAIKCDVPHRFIRETLSGQSEEPPVDTEKKAGDNE